MLSLEATKKITINKYKYIHCIIYYNVHPFVSEDVLWIEITKV